MGPTPALKSARRSAPHNPPMAHYVSGKAARARARLLACAYAHRTGHMAHGMYRCDYPAMWGRWATPNKRAAPRARPVRGRAAQCANGARGGRGEVVECGADPHGSARPSDAQGAGDTPSAPEPQSCNRNTHIQRSAYKPRTQHAKIGGGWVARALCRADAGVQHVYKHVREQAVLTRRESRAGSR